MVQKQVSKDYAAHGLNSEVYVAFNLTEKIQLIGGTWYGGEMKKGLFSMMNYYLPLQGIASMHCSLTKEKMAMWLFSSDYQEQEKLRYQQIQNVN